MQTLQEIENKYNKSFLLWLVIISKGVLCNRDGATASGTKADLKAMNPESSGQKVY